MNQFIFKKGCSELHLFPHIAEIGLKKNTNIQFNSLKAAAIDSLRLYYILDGKFEWVINNHHCILYPGDLAIVLPGHVLGGEKDFLDIGTVVWIHIELDQLSLTGKMVPGKWSRLSENESRTIGKILVLNNLPVLSKVKEAGVLFQQMQQELFNQEIGYSTRINQLTDELFILIARQLTHQNNSRRDFPRTFMKLEHTLRENSLASMDSRRNGSTCRLGNDGLYRESEKLYGLFSIKLSN